MTAVEYVQYPGVTYIVPCGAAKLDRPAPARELYTGQMFRHTLANVERLAAQEHPGGHPARVLILSAKYGLLEPDEVIAPYNLRMDQHGSIGAITLATHALALGIADGSQVVGFLPKTYMARLEESMRLVGVYPYDAYEGAQGIGEQRGINSRVARPDRVPDPPAGPGPRVWTGGDVNAFSWGIEILVSYGRLREAKTLPVATAAWVCDSRGFNEIADHGRWTIPAEQYVADLRRYAVEIGHMQWAAPQDWPAAQHLLDRTGLTEREHQEKTIASVLELRALAPELPIICVVTGADLAGYLRHVEMYLQAGIDLRAERLVVGVGALVGRDPQDAADIIQALYDAGLCRLHGFGIKARVCDLVGALLESIDSAAWSFSARRRGGKCPHGLVVWERNCPHAARVWAEGLRARAARSQVQPPGGPAGTGPGRGAARRRRAGAPVYEQTDLLAMFDVLADALR